MSAPTFYHGTRRGFGPRGRLWPRSLHGGAGTSAPLAQGRQAPERASEWVYVTTSLDLAWVYAFHGIGRGRPKVLVVQPHGSLEADPEHSAAMEAYRCEEALVVKVLTEPTMTEQEARAGWVT